MNILVVEDSVVMRERLVELVADACGEADIAEAGSVLEALSHLGSKPFDLVLLDMLLPDGDGTTVLEVVKQRMPSTRVAVMTRFPAFSKRCQVLKADYFFNKYEDMDNAMTTIRMLAGGQGTGGVAGTLGERG